MDWQIFLLYLKKIQNKEKLSNWWDAFKTLPRKLKIVFSIYFLDLLIMIICAIISDRVEKVSIILWISMVILTFIICTSSYEDVKRTIDEKRSHHKLIMNILKSEGVIKKNQIKQLHKRLTLRLNKHKESNQKIEKYIITSFQILIIPFLLMIMSNVFGLDGEFENKIILCFVLLLLTISFSIIIIMLINIISFICSRQFADLELFLSLLQDILDYEFEIENSDIL